MVTPTTQEPVFLFYSTDSVSLTLVTPATPLPVTFTASISASITPVISTTFTPSQVTVSSTSSILVLAGNANRKGATILNAGSVPLYLAQTSSLTTTTGFPVPVGSSYNVDEPLYTGSFYGIVTTGSQTANIVELT